MNFLDRFGPADQEMLRTALELRAAIVIDGQVLRVQIRPHRAVKDDDAFLQGVEKVSHLKIANCQLPIVDCRLPILKLPF